MIGFVMNDYLIPNLVKASQLLSLLARSRKALSATEIESALELPKATAFRILRTFEHMDYVVKKNGKFKTGPALVEIGILSLTQVEIRKIAVPVLQKLTDETGFTSHLAIPSGYKSLILEVRDSPNPVQVASRPGSLVDLYCSSTGKVFLAYLYDQEIEEVFRQNPPQAHTRKTITNLTGLRKSIENVRKLGYAMDDQEYHDEIRCVAAPVKNINNEVIAAIGVTAPTVQFPESNQDKVIQSVIHAAQFLSNQMGSI